MTKSAVSPTWEEVDDSVNTEKSNGLNDYVKNDMTSFPKNL